MATCFLLVNPLHGHLLHVVHHLVGGLVLKFVVQVPLFNHLGKMVEDGGVDDVLASTLATATCTAL